MSREDQFFDDLDKRLTNRRYAKRLAEELREHLQDAQAVDDLSGTLSLERLGSPELISQYYNSAMLHSRLWYICVETAIFAFVSLPLYFIVFLLALAFADGDALQGGYVDLLTATVSIFAICFIILPIFSSISQQNILDYFEEKRIRNALFVILYGPVSCLALLGIFSGFLNGDTEPVLPSIFVLFAIFLSSYLAHWFRVRQITIPRWTMPAMGLTVITYLVGTHYIIYFAAELLNDAEYPFIVALTTPRGFFELAGYLILTMVSFVVEFVLNAAMGQLAIALLVFGVGLFAATRIGLWFRDRSQAFPWIHAILMIYAVLLLSTPREWGPTVTWHTPVYEASEAIERQQFGPFLRFVRFFNAEEGRFARYTAVANERGFDVVQARSNTYAFDLSQGLNKASLKSVVFKSPDVPSLLPDLAEGVTCNGKTVSSDLPDEPTSYIVDGQPEVFIGCKELAFNGQPIATFSVGTFGGLIVSGDGKYGAVLIGTGAYNPNYLYFIELPQANP